MSGPRENCPSCRKPKRPSHKGSLTGFLFENLYCLCDETVTSTPAVPTRQQCFCPKCGMMIPDSYRSGTFTSFLFQDIRCRCASSDGSARPLGIPGVQKLSKRFALDHSALNKLTTQKNASKFAQAVGTIDTLATFELERGDVIDGSYQLLELIGQGGMGVVFLSRHVSLERTCALKILSPAMYSETSWMMFQNEAKIVAALNHPSICPIYDLGIYKERLPFYAMEYLPGETLEQVLLKQGTLSLGAVAEVFEQLADGLAYAHERGVIHKDIKPGNIMLVPRSENEITIKVLDFGLAELNAPGKSNIRIDRAVGTAAYMSPERFAGGASDHRSDLYSIGCSIFEALTGSLPFEGTDEELAELHARATIPLMQERTGIQFPHEIEAVVRKCLAKNPNDRYQSAQDLRTDLLCVLDGEPLRVAQNESKQLAEKPTPKQAPNQDRRRLAVALCLLSAIVVGTAFGANVFTNRFQMEKPLPLEGDERSQQDALLQKSAGVSLNHPLVVQQSGSQRTLAQQPGLDKRSQSESEPSQSDSLEPMPEVPQSIVEGSTPSELYGLAIRRIGKKDYRGAIPFMNAAIAKKPSSVEFRKRRGELYFAIRDIDATLNETEELLAIDPKNVDAYYLRGNCHWERKEAQAAIDAYESVLKIDPKEMQANFNLSRLYHEEFHDHPKAEMHIRRAIELCSSQRIGDVSRLAEYHSQYGHLLGHRGKFKEALKEFDEAIKLNPKNAAEVYYEKTELFIPMRREKDALASAEKAVELDPNNSKYLCNLGLRRMKSGFPRAAVAAPLKRALELDPKNASALEGMAVLNLSHGDRASAKRYFDAAIEADPMQSYFYLERSKLLAEMGQSKESMIDIEKARRIHALNMTQNKGVRGARMPEPEDFKKIIDGYSHVISVNPNSASSYFGRGCSYFCIGDYFRARKDFESVSKTSRGSDKKLDAVARVYSSFCSAKLSPKARTRISITDDDERQISDWPAVIPAFAAGRKSEADLLKCSTSTADNTISHFVIAMQSIIDGDTTNGEKHLNWVVDKGERTADEYMMSVCELAALHTDLKLPMSRVYRQRKPEAESR